MTEFFQMGGYAIYVWPAYLVTAVALVVTLVAPLRRRARIIRELSTIATQRDNQQPK
ncbi:MAG: heme exporter protein CcmD [Arenicellales bacterium]